jgi:hypothetical protein
MQVHTRGSHGPCFTSASHGGKSIRTAKKGMKQRYRLCLYCRFARGSTSTSFVLCHPITPYTIEPVATSQPVV